MEGIGGSNDSVPVDKGKEEIPTNKSDDRPRKVATRTLARQQSMSELEEWGWEHPKNQRRVWGAPPNTRATTQTSEQGNLVVLGKQRQSKGVSISPKIPPNQSYGPRQEIQPVKAAIQQFQQNQSQQTTKTHGLDGESDQYKEVAGRKALLAIAKKLGKVKPEQPEKYASVVTRELARHSDVLRNLEEIEGATDLKQFLFFVRNLASGTQSPLAPSQTLTRTLEDYSAKNLCGFRMETVPETDLSQAHGPHCDDMAGFRQVKNGPTVLVVTDGEGGQRRSDTFSACVNSAALSACVMVGSRLVTAAEVGQDEQGASVADLQKAVLQHAYVEGGNQNTSYLRTIGIDPSREEGRGGTTLSCVMSLPSTKHKDQVWINVINVYDSPVIILDPSSGRVECHQTAVNINLDTEHFHRQGTGQVDLARVEAFVNKHPYKSTQYSMGLWPKETMMMAMSDGVTDSLRIPSDSLPTLTKREQFERVNKETAEALIAVVTNPLFDQVPDLPCDRNTLTQDIPGKHSTALTQLSPPLVVSRVKNFVTWSNRERRTLEHASSQIESLIDRAEFSKPVESDLTCKYTDDQGTWRLLPASAVKAYLEELGIDPATISTLQVSEFDINDLSGANQARVQEAFPGGDLGRLVRVNSDALDRVRAQVSEGHKATPGKTDGVTLLVARAGR